MRQIYLDHNSTTPVLPEVTAAMAVCDREVIGNPASQHAAGRKARQTLEETRAAVGRMLGARIDTAADDQVIFTSGGTEANNLALFGLAGDRPAHAVISAIEHPCVSEPAEQLARRGWRIDLLPVTADGVAIVDRLPELIGPDTRLVSVMLANHETGVLQPVAHVAEICRKAGVLLHTDAVQAAGKLPVDFQQLGVHSLAVSAHKFHGPRGVGALLVSHDTPVAPQTFGGFQQSGVRPGTESVSLAVGLRTALEICHRDGYRAAAEIARRRDRLELALRRGWPNLIVNGVVAERLPQTSNVSFPGLDRQAILMALDLAGVVCSAGAACASGSSRPSPVLQAMGLDKRVILGSIRISLGSSTSDDEVDEAAARMLSICSDLERSILP